MHHTSDGYLPRNEADIRAGIRVATAILLVLGLLHAWASWGYAGAMWTSHGAWLHALERYASGEAPYRDFAWSYPPLALWMVGGIARITGAGLTAVSLTTIALYLGILAVFFQIVQRLTREVSVPVIITSLLFATAYACSSGVPLPLGTAAVGDAVGVLFLLGAVLAALESARTHQRTHAVLVGVLAGLSCASSQELWVAAPYVVLIGALVLKRADSPRAAVALVAAFLLVLVVVFGFIAVAYGAGPATLLRHSALVPAAIETTLPTAERLAIEAVTVSAFTLFATTSLWLCLAIPDRTAARWAGGALLVFLCSSATHLGMTVSRGIALATNGPSQYPGVIEAALIWAQRSGLSVRMAALRILDDRFREHLFPVLLPIFLLAVVLIRWKSWKNTALRNQVASLLGLCLAARSSSGFRGTDWYNVLLEIVTYVQMMRLGGEAALRQAGRAVLAVLATLMIVGGYTYFSQARGPLTLRGPWPAIDTPRGRVRWEPWNATRYQRVQRVLASHGDTASRPLLAFGPTGGWNYFMGRPNPSPVMVGFHELDSAAMERVMNDLIAMRPGPVLIDHPWVPTVEVLDIRPWYWQAVRGPSRYLTIDRPQFDRLRNTCVLFGPADSTVVARFYDCAPQATR